MKFLHLQLQYDASQLTLSIQTHQNTQHFQLEGPVSDAEELAHQAELFVGIHVRPYFDILPVDSCRLSVAAEVPDLVRNGCMSELIKASKTNEVLTAAKEDVAVYLQADRSMANKLLCIYSDLMPLEGLIHITDIASDAQNVESVVIGYLPAQEPRNDLEHSLRLFTADPDAWFAWYRSLGCEALLCGQDFVSEVERQGVVLSALLASLGHTLIIIEPGFELGHPLRQYDKRATDSRAKVHYIQDEQSLLWGRWLGLNNIQLGPIKSVQYTFNVLAFSDALKNASLDSCHFQRDRQLLTAHVQPNEQPLQVLVCEDLYLRRLISWLSQAYYVKELLDQRLDGSLSGIVAVNLWLSVMRRLIVGSHESTDYDVIILVRRLELIAQAVQSLQLIDFIQQLEGKAEVIVCGHSDWHKLCPHQFREGYQNGDWLQASQAFPNALLLLAEPVFSPLLSKKCFESIVHGNAVGCFASGLCHMSDCAQEEIIGLDWLKLHNVINPDACCVHAMSMANNRETMRQKRQAVVDAVAQHNALVGQQLYSRSWSQVESPLVASIEKQIQHWNQGVEAFYEAHSQMFQDSLIVLNPQTELGITDDLRANAPAYLATVLAQMSVPEQQRESVSSNIS